MTELIQSPILQGVGVPHAFSTRAGGVSRGMFESLNFGNPGDLRAEERDPKANIAENWRRLTAGIGASRRAVVEVHQVHGPQVHVASGAQTGPDPKADAIVTMDPTHLAAVRVADCAPILLSSEDGRVTAAVHAGWRGVVAGVVPRAIAVMRERTARAIVAAVGPCIGPEAFEVGPELLAEFRAAFGERVIRERAGGKGDVDLQASLEIQLRGSGVTRYDLVRACTASDPARFFSHRRDAGRTGRMVGVIGPASSTADEPRG